MNKTIVVIRPTATRIRIDEYWGWIKDILKWQENNFDINIILLDLPNLLHYKQKNAVNNYMNITEDLMMLGIDFNKVNLILQSQVPEIQEMTAYLQYLKSSFNNVIKNTSTKNINTDVIDNFKSFFNALTEIAIIIIFFSNIVLIDKHKIKIVELARDFINKFNSNFDEILKLPRSFVSRYPKLIGLDGKETLNENNCLLFSDDKDDIENKIRTAITDSGSEVKFNAKKKPYISNLINLYQFLTNKTYDEIENEFQGKKYFEFKNSLTKQLNKFLKLCVKRSALRNENFIRKLLRESTEKVRDKLRKNLEIIKKAMNFPH